MEIFEATVCRFNERERTDLGYRYSIDLNNYRKILCINENDEYIDINTGKSYYKIKKSKNGFILEEELPHIELNVDYINDIKLLKQDEVSIIDLFKAKATKKLCEGQQKKLKR